MRGDKRSPGFHAGFLVHRPGCPHMRIIEGILVRPLCLSVALLQLPVPPPHWVVRGLRIGPAHPAVQNLTSQAPAPHTSDLLLRIPMCDGNPQPEAVCSQSLGPIDTVCSLVNWGITHFLSDEEGRNHGQERRSR